MQEISTSKFSDVQDTMIDKAMSKVASIRGGRHFYRDDGGVLYADEDLLSDELKTHNPDEDASLDSFAGEGLYPEPENEARFVITPAVIVGIALVAAAVGFAAAMLTRF